MSVGSSQLALKTKKTFSLLDELSERRCGLDLLFIRDDKILGSSQIR